MSTVEPPAGASAPTLAEVRAAARNGVREAVAAGGESGRLGRGWAVPLTAASVVAAAACAPVAWPLLAGGTTAVPAALTAAFAQVGGAGGALLSEVVIRAWDRIRAREGRGAGQGELRGALAAELREALVACSPAAAGLRAELAGVLQGVDAIKVALTTTIETTVQDSGEQVRAVLIRGLRDLGTQFSEFGWLLEEVSDQLTGIAVTQAELAAESRAMLEAQQRTLMHLTILRQRARTHPRDGELGNQPESIGESLDEARVAALETAGIPADLECPYPGLVTYGPQDADRFFGRRQLTAGLVARLAEQLARPGLLIVVGPSGSGKSSVLRAGLLPAIAAGGLPIREADMWPADLMTPGPRPLLELAARVAALAGIPAGVLEADLRADPQRITAAIRQALLAHHWRGTQLGGLDPPCTPDATCSGAGPDLSRHPVDRTGTAAGQTADTSLGGEAPPPRLILIVDQFEELFTQCADEMERRAFIQALCAAAGTSMLAAPLPGDVDRSRGLPSPRLAQAMVVIGIRADFYGRSAAYPELVPYLQDGQVLVGPIDQAGLRAAIEGPAAQAGLVVDTGLVELLLADLGLHPLPPGPLASIPEPRETPALETTAHENGAALSEDGGSYEPGRLPLLACALHQTWQHREGRRLTVASYRATGGIDGAVASAAEAVYEGLGGEGKQAARRLLLRLVSLGEGTADTRRRVTVTELTGTTGPTTPADTPQALTAQAVLANLIRARLLTAGTDSGGAQTVQISHEALLSAWPRLRWWLSQDRAGQRIHRDLTDAARAWQAQGRDSSHLFAGTRLAVAREWADGHRQDLNADELIFLSASQRHERRAARMRRAAVTALAVLTLLSAATAGVAVHDNSQAVSARNQAITNQVAAEAEQLQATDPSLAAQLELVNRRLDPTPDNTASLLSSANIPLSNVLTEPTGPIWSVAYSPDGHTLAAGSNDGSTWLWNMTNPAHPTHIGPPLTGPLSPASSVALSPDGRTLAAGGYNGKIWLWNITNRAHPTRIGQPLRGPAWPTDSLAFSPDGHALAEGSNNGTTWLWNLTDPAHPVHLGRPRFGRLPYILNSVWSVAFSPDGHTLAAGSNDGTTRLWNVTDAAHPTAIGQPLTGPTGVWSVAFSPDGRTLAAGSEDGTIWLWDVTDPAQPTQIRQPLTGFTAPVRSVAFSPNGHTLAAGSDDDTIRLWNVTDPTHPAQIGQPLAGAIGPVYSVAFSPDGHTLAAGSADGTIRLWSLPSTILSYQTGPIYSVAFSPDGHTLAAGGQDAKVWLWNVTNPAHPTTIGQPLTGPTQPVESVAFSPDGRILAAGGDDGTIWLWNVANPAHPTTIVRPLTGATGSLYSVAFSPDGHVLAAGGQDTKVWLWNVTDPARAAQTVQPLTGPFDSIESVAFSPDSDTLAAGSGDGTIWLWNVTDLAKPTRLGQNIRSSTGAVRSVAFSPDGHTLAAGTYNGTMRLWNVTDPAQPSHIGQLLTGPAGFIDSVAFSPDGHTLAASDHDGAIWLWNVTDPTRTTQIGVLTGPTGPVSAVAFSPDAHTLAGGSTDGTIRLWSLNVEQAVDRICATTSGNLTPQQWARYIPQLPYEPPCQHP